MSVIDLLLKAIASIIFGAIILWILETLGDGRLVAALPESAFVAKIIAYSLIGYGLLMPFEYWYQLRVQQRRKRRSLKSYR